MKKSYGRITARSLLVLLFFTLFLIQASSFAAEFNFKWDANTEPDLAGYRLYYKSSSCCEPYNGTGADQGDSPISIALSGLADPSNPQYTITGLADNTIYFFSITAVDVNDIQSDYADELNNIPPSITSQPVVVSRTDVSAVIEWQTDQPATSRVDYGISDSYGAQVEKTEYVSNHSVSISGLTPETAYHFKVSAVNAAGFGPNTLASDNNPSSDAVFTTDPDTTPDTTAPIILTGPVVTSKTDTSATIAWTTNENGTSEVRYGKASAAWGSYPSVKTLSTSVSSHSVTLTGLSGATAYYFRVGSTDLSGNGPDKSTTDNNPSNEVNFTTNTTPDTTAPVITTAPTATAVSAYSATIVWQTNELSDSRVEFGTSTAYTSSKSSTDDVLNHGITLTGLAAATLYHFRVGSTDSAGNGPTLSADYTFTTGPAPDTTAPQIIAGPSVISKTDTSVTISWNTDELSNSQVQYSPLGPKDWGTYELSRSDTTMVTQHVITLNSLNPSSLYFYQVGSSDTSGNGPLTSSTDNNPSLAKSFETEQTPDTTAPQIVSAPTITAKTSGSLTVAWSTDEPSSSLVQYGEASSVWGEYALQYIDTQRKTTHQAVIGGLKPETRYYLRVGGSDAFDNGPATSPDDNNPSTEVKATTDPFIDTTAPKITSPPAVTTKTDTSARIEWSTDEPANSLIQYGTASAWWDAYPLSSSDGAMVTQHAVTLTGLNPATTYFYTVGSVDESGNGPTLAVEAGFTTAQTVDDTSPRITVPPTVTGIADTTATIEWQTDEPSSSEVKFRIAPVDNSPFAWTNTAVQTVIQASMVTQHSVVLTNLSGGTRYQYMVGSTDSSGNGPDPSDPESNNPFTIDTFVTEVAIDATAPKILTGPAVSAADNQSAIIAWTTDEPSNSMVKFGEQGLLQNIVGGTTWGNLPWSESDARMKTSHSVTITGLNPVTTYVYRVGSTDVAGNGPDLNADPTNASVMGTFTTEEGPDESAPNITNVVVSFVTNKTALITWETDEPGNSMLAYGEAGSSWEGYLFSETDADMVKYHSVTLTGLQPATLYYFRVGSMDANSNGPTLNANENNPSDESSFTSATGPDETAPQVVAGSVQATTITDRTAVIEWDTDEPGNSQVQYATASRIWGTYEYSENDAAMVTQHRVTLTQLSPGTLYYFRVSATDASGNNHASSLTDHNPSIEYNLSTQEADPPSLIGYGDEAYPDNAPRVNYADNTIEISYDELNMQQAADSANYLLSPSMNFLDAGTSIEELGGGGEISTYRLYFMSIPAHTVITLTVTQNIVDADGYAVNPATVILNDRDGDELPDDWEIEVGLNPNSGDASAGEGKEGDFDGDGASNYLEFLNNTDPKVFNLSDIPPQIAATIPHDGAGLTGDNTRISNQTAVAALIVDTGAGIDSTQIALTIDDGANLPYSVNSADSAIFRIVKLNSDELDTAVSACWVVYDRSADSDRQSVYPFDAEVQVRVRVTNTTGLSNEADFAFRIESEMLHNVANDPNRLPDADPVEADDPDLFDAAYVYDAGILVATGDLQGAKILHSALQPNDILFGLAGEVPRLYLENVKAVGTSLNLQPPSVFSVPAKLFIPCPGYQDVSGLNVYFYNGREWVSAYDKSAVQPGGYGWAVPDSRKNHNKGNPSTIEIKVYHLSGAQAGEYLAPASPRDSESDDERAEASCFIDMVER